MSWGYNQANKSSHPRFFWELEGRYNDGSHIWSETYLTRTDSGGGSYRPFAVGTYDSNHAEVAFASSIVSFTDETNNSSRSFGSIQNGATPSMTINQIGVLNFGTDIGFARQGASELYITNGSTGLGYTRMAGILIASGGNIPSTDPQYSMTCGYYSANCQFIAPFVLGWGPSALDSSSIDVGITRAAVGVLEVTNGSTGLGSLTDAYCATALGGSVSSATTITPTGSVFHVTGVTAIATINLPFVGFVGAITIIPDGIFATTTAGNIALVSTAVVNKALIMTDDGTKWYPSY